MWWFIAIFNTISINAIFNTISVNSSPKDKILNWTKFKAFADDKINVSEKLKFMLGRVENIVGKGENASYHHFLLFPQYFQKASQTGSELCGKGLNHRGQ